MRKELLIFLCMVLVFNSSEGFTISEAGEFTLGGSLVESGSVLVIATSNVIVNLDGNIISGGTTGIVINSGLTNITIKNGFIKDCTKGISVGANCTFITFSDIEICNCSGRAIEVLGTSGNTVNNITFNNFEIHNGVDGMSTDYAITFSLVNDITINNMVLSRNGTSSLDLSMINFETCNKAQCNNVQILCNQGSTFNGFRLNITQNCVFSNCIVQGNSVTSDFRGFFMTGGTTTKGNLYKKCIVASNVSSGGFLRGFDFDPFVTRNGCKRCIVGFNRTTAASKNCFGFNLDQAKISSLVRCRAMYNQATGTGSLCAGFNLGSTAGGLTNTVDTEAFKNVAVANNAATDANSFGYIIKQGGAKGDDDENCFICNFAFRNGPTVPVAGNQFDDLKKGAQENLTAATLNFDTEYTNLGIIF